MTQQNTDEESEWRGSWWQAISEVEKFQRLGIEEISTVRYGRPMTVADLWELFESRELLPKELLPLAQRAVPAPRPVTKREPTQGQLDALVETLRDVVPSSTRINVNRLGPQHVKSLQLWVKVFQVVKAKFPLPWRVMERVVKRIDLEGNYHGTAEASWNGHLTIAFREGVSNDRPGTLIHELGHAFEDIQRDQYEISSWQREYGNPPFAHSYFETRAVEDFAECFRMFFQEASLLKRKAPAKHKDMAERVLSL